MTTLAELRKAADRIIGDEAITPTEMVAALDAEVPGWRDLDPEDVQTALREAKADLMREMDGWLDTYNALKEDRA
jgi:hypothetical protein